jgi:hypothetical protein
MIPTKLTCRRDLPGDGLCEYAECLEKYGPPGPSPEAVARGIVIEHLGILSTQGWIMPRGSYNDPACQVL